MSIFNHYQREGRGVTKEEAASVTPIKRFGTELVHRFWQLIVLNLLYLLACLPIITIGPATAALNYVCRNFSQAKPVSFFSDFIEKCKEHFRQGIVVGLIQAVLAFVLWWSFNAWTLDMPDTVPLPTGLKTVAVVLIFFVAYLLICGSFYLYPMMASFDLTVKQLIRNSVILAMTQLWRNLVIVAVGGILGFVSLFFFPLTLPIPLFFLFSFTAYLGNSLVFPVLKKYVAAEKTETLSIPKDDGMGSEPDAPETESPDGE